MGMPPEGRSVEIEDAEWGSSAGGCSDAPGCGRPGLRRYDRLPEWTAPHVLPVKSVPLSCSSLAIWGIYALYMH